VSNTVPLFPLNTVLFPGGPLPLRVFEPRYLDMVSTCLKDECGIGVIMIKKGNEVGPAPETHEIGTLTYISYWHKRDDGMLGVTLRGEQRFRMLEHTTQANQLVIAEIELIDNFSSHTLTEAYQPMVELLKQILSQLEPPYTSMATHFNDAEWVSARLIELLPLQLMDKYELLKLDDVQERLERLDKYLQQRESW